MQKSPYAVGCLPCGAEETLPSEEPMQLHKAGAQKLISHDHLPQLR